mgnify:CR=1 FL=1
MATNWVDEVLSGATSTGSKTLSLATGNALSVANSSSESIFTVTSDTSNGGYTSILGIEGQEAVLFLGADNADDAGDAWEVHSDTSGNFKIGNRTSGTGSPTRSNTFTNALSIDSSRNATIAGDLTITGGNITNALTCDGTLTSTGVFTASSTASVAGLLTATSGVKLGNNIIYASDGGQTITLDTSDNVTILGDLTVSGSKITFGNGAIAHNESSNCLLYTSPSPRDATLSRMASSG